MIPAKSSFSLPQKQLFVMQKVTFRCTKSNYLPYYNKLFNLLAIFFLIG